MMVIAALDFETVMVISDIITAESRPENIYTQIKNRLISTFAISSEARLRQLIEGELQGDQKPLLILGRIRNVGQGKCRDEVLRNVFLEQLPSSCRAALALNDTTDITKLAELADRFIDATGQNRSSSTDAVSMQSIQEKLMAKMDELTERVDALSVRSENRCNQNYGSSNQRNRSRSSDGRNFNKRINYQQKNNNGHFNSRSGNNRNNFTRNNNKESGGNNNYGSSNNNLCE